MVTFLLLAVLAIGIEARTGMDRQHDYYEPTQSFKDIA
jgi:hypothetical protein